VRRGEIDGPTLALDVAELAGRGTIYGDDPLVVAKSLADWALLLPDNRPLPDEEAALKSVRPVDLARAAARYFTPERSYTGWYEPLASRDGVRRAARLCARLPSYLIRRTLRRRRHDDPC
jgi:hypothetical protein